MVISQNLRLRITRLGSSPTINGVAAVASVLAGALASFFTGSIRSSLALPANPSDGSAFALSNFSLGGDAIVFWVLVVLAASLFAWSKYSDSATDNEHKDFLSKSFKSLESMPPDIFLGHLSLFYKECRETASRSQEIARLSGKADTTDVDEAIKFVLKKICFLADSYDGKIDRNYRASVLLFSREWPVEKLDRAVNANMIAREAYIGTLVVDEKLNTTHEPKKSIAPFDNLDPYALPVLKSSGEFDFENTFPGAPVAFSAGRVFECSSVTELLEGLSAKYLGNQISPLKSLYSTGACKNVRSFISLPIQGDKWRQTKIDWADLSVIGTVNIECSSESSFRSASVLFAPVVQPFLFLISDLLLLRAAIEH